MRHANQMPVVGTRQRRSAGREDDVVGMAVEAGEARTPRRAFGAGQRGQPGVAAPHLAGVGRVGETCHPGAVVRRGNGHHPLHPRVGLRGIGLRRQPGTHRQPAHAVRHQQRWPTGLPGQRCHGGLDCRHPVVDAAEHRLHRQSPAWHAPRTQLPQPGRPQTAVAAVTVQQEHGGAAVGSGTRPSARLG